MKMPQYVELVKKQIANELVSKSRIFIRFFVFYFVSHSHSHSLSLSLKRKFEMK